MTRHSEHQGRVDPVRNHLGYDVGYAAACSCGWVGDLQPTQREAVLGDYAAHVKDTTAIKETA